MQAKSGRVLGLGLSWWVAACAASPVPSARPSAAPSAVRAPTPSAAASKSIQSPSRALPPDSQVQQILAERIGEAAEQYGIVVGLLDAGGRRVVSRGGFDQGKPRALDGDTLFELGSITKVFTALLLQLAVERGEVGLDDPIGQHLPAGTKTPSLNGQPITLRHLATHTSGLPRVPGNLKSKNANDPYADYTVEDLYEFLGSVELPREPGSEYAYSNLGAAVLARVLIVRTGKSFAELVRERITEPLGMAHTWVDLPAEEKLQLATGHTQGLMDAPLRTRIAMIGNGGVFASASDLLTFLSASMGLVQTPLAHAFEQLAAPQKPLNDRGDAIGLGWHIQKAEGGNVVWHNGGTAGFSTYAAYVREQGVGVVVLSNVSTSDGVDDIGEHLIAQGPLQPAGAPGVTPRPRAAVAVAAQRLDGYVGDYQVANGLRIALRRQGDQLWATVKDRTFPLFAQSETVFFLDLVDLTFRFETDAQGKAVTMFLGQGGKEVTMPRVQAPAAAAARQER
ncbi:MAG: D-alanyl-D-alanine-carboxypeptidase/endopeptidase AmpH precursor [Pseudomonadota bacterium]